jgi:hypothetical protein
MSNYLSTTKCRAARAEQVISSHDLLPLCINYSPMPIFKHPALTYIFYLFVQKTNARDCETRSKKAVKALRCSSKEETPPPPLHYIYCNHNPPYHTHTHTPRWRLPEKKTRRTLVAPPQPTKKPPSSRRLQQRSEDGTELVVLPSCLVGGCQLFAWTSLYAPMPDG